MKSRIAFKSKKNSRLASFDLPFCWFPHNSCCKCRNTINLKLITLKPTNLYSITGEGEQQTSRNVRIKRAKKPRASGNPHLGQEPNQRLDEVEVQQPLIPKNHQFLSPSVKEYLELGKSIPGRPGSDYPILGKWVMNIEGYKNRIWTNNSFFMHLNEQVCY